jgi:pimeloyl-ACP methyl ester carboxylesterase
MARELRIGDVTFFVEDEGAGPPIVFIHGWSMSGRFFQRQLSHFAAAHRVIIPDLRGHGRVPAADRRPRAGAVRRGREADQPKAGQYIASQIPGARLQTFPASSHCPFWEESDAFNSAVGAFAAGLGG